MPFAPPPPLETLSSYPEIRLPAVSQERLRLPLGLSPVSAGFPSPAEDYEDKRLDINDYLVSNRASTFFFQVQGCSMEGAQIFDGDMLVVDRSVRPVHGQIVVAFLDGERLVKRLHHHEGRVALLAEHPEYPDIELTGETELVIWGVVVGKFSKVPA